jgi:predicted DNA-binding transcriptional regulator AlpA
VISHGGVEFLQEASICNLAGPGRNYTMDHMKTKTTQRRTGKRYFRTADLADLLGYTQATIRNLARDGALPKPIQIGKQRRWTVEAILTFARERGIDVRHLEGGGE